MKVFPKIQAGRGSKPPNAPNLSAESKLEFLASGFLRNEEVSFLPNSISSRPFDPFPFPFRTPARGGIFYGSADLRPADLLKEIF